MQQYQCPFCRQQFSLPAPVVTAHCPVCGREFQSAGTAVPPEAPSQRQNFQNNQQAGNPYGTQEPGLFDDGPSGKSRGVAALLAILLGGLGVHFFYLGKVGGGIVCILLSLVTCGIWPILMLVQGVVMLTMKQDDFERKYVYSDSFMPLF
ncbi:MAG: DUF4234 domain-containing protein [Alloprevotella sp.]|nr:DUF4234 domain-containing protein [Alloprevotella sp.]